VLSLAEATLSDWDYVLAANRQVVRERVYLYRTLRKLNMVRPWPSASSFVSVSIERGDRESLQHFLSERAIELHFPDDPSLATRIRISAVSHRATASLSSALIDWARTI
jgi:histidinol-phosphate/aromatic aminotransferase/cobyric acid decarboxylase-like protein